MENQMEQDNNQYIVFRVDSNLYTLNSASVMAIREMPSIASVPDASDGMRGMFEYMDHVIPMLDLRTILGKQTLNYEYEEFVDMLEQRKQDHYKWMEELNRSVEAHEPFKLATDPHKCAFGQWYYDFKTENNAINYHMRKIEEPHRLLHEAALETVGCKQEHDKCTRTKCLKDVLYEAEHVYAKAVIDLIEEAKYVMKDSYREMALVIRYEHKYYGISVDEVLSVEAVEENGKRKNISAISESSLIKAIKKSPHYQNELIIELDEDHLFTRSK
ncbi:MAG: chemotaxis protein CheW [Lachnospiraceae bacterium]